MHSQTELLQALEKSEKKYRDLVQNANSIIVQMDPKGFVTFFNKFAQDFFGYSEDEILGQNVIGTIVPETDASGRNITTMIENIGKYPERYIKNENENMCRNGERVWIAWTNKAFLDDQGRIVEILSIGNDFTEHKQMDEALRQSEEKYRTLIENIQDGVFLIQDKKLILVNEAFARIGGYTVEEIQGKDFMKFIAPEDLEMVEDRYFRRQAGEKQPREYEFRILQKDGVTRTVVYMTVGLFNYQGRPAALGTVKDITERKQMDEALRQSEEKYRTLIENIQDGVFVIQDRKLRFVNEAFARMGGCTVEEITGGNFGDFVAPEDLEMVADRYVRMMAGEDVPMEYEFYALQKDRVTRTIVHMTVGLINYQGRLAALGTVKDITERKQMDEALRQSEEKYRTLVENIQDGVFLIQDKKLKFVNEAFLKIGGYTADEIVGKEFRDFVAPEDLEMVADRYVRMMAGEDVPMEYEFRGIKKDGITRTVVHMTVGLINYQGKFVALGTVKDITERKQMERALAAERERLAVTLRSIGDGVIATDAEGKVTLLNKLAENLTGWSQEKAVGKPLNEVFRTINENSRRPCENPVEKVLKIGTFFNIADNTVLIARDGTEKAIADSAAPILDKHSKIVGVVLVFRDVTEKQKFEQELQKTAKLESVGILAGGIAHDFNNILTSILGNITLANIYTKSDNKISNRLKEAEKACLRAKDLTQQLLTFSKGGKPVKKPISIAMLAKESAALSLSGSNSRCKFFIPSDLWLVEADEGQINQVINNLLINADQAMPEGGIIEIHCENIVIEANGHLPLKKGDYVKILIKDNGIGISKDHLSKIFDPYFTTKHKGSGLGLATVYSIIKRHEGHIRIESEVGIGTIFHIYLPASEKRQKILQKETSKVARGAGKILLMDDEEMILEIMDKILRELGYEVEFARDGNEAIDLYKKARVSGHPFASVIMDLTIPGGMGGREAIQKLREIDPNVKAIVSSGYSTDPVMSNFRKYGFCGVLTKPFKIKELGEILKEVMS